MTFINVDDPYSLELSTVNDGEVGGDEGAAHPSSSPVDDATNDARPSDHAFQHDTLLDTGTSLLPFTPRHVSSLEPPEDDPGCQVNERILTVCLLNQFKTGPGSWYVIDTDYLDIFYTHVIRMDIFDTGAYFSHQVPIMASSRPLLKSAVGSLAAKHLQHVCSVLNRSPADLSRYGGPALTREVDWQYQAIKHYHSALRHLKDAVLTYSFSARSSKKEELFAAVAILCMYELMDAPGTAWGTHLKALPLFSTEDGSESASFSPVLIPRETINGSIFWNLARQDLLYACQSWVSRMR